MTVRTRLVAVATTGLLAVAALSACQATPGAAAFVGDSRISESRITTALDDITTNSSGVSTEQLRALMVQDLAFIDIANIYADQKGYQLPAATGAQAAQIASSAFTVKDAQTNEFFTSYVQSRMDAEYLLGKQAAVTPTDAELQAAVDELLAIQAIKPGNDENVKKLIAADKNAQVAIGLKRELDKVIAANPVSVSPRYSPTCSAAPCPGLGFTLYSEPQQNTPIVTIPFVPADDSPVVLDLPRVGTDTEAPVAPGGAQ